LLFGSRNWTKNLLNWVIYKNKYFTFPSVFFFFLFQGSEQCIVERASGGKFYLVPRYIFSHDSWSLETFCRFIFSLPVCVIRVPLLKQIYVAFAVATEWIHKTFGSYYYNIAKALGLLNNLKRQRRWQNDFEWLRVK
jgi:hypothetical protein